MHIYKKKNLVYYFAAPGGSVYERREKAMQITDNEQDLRQVVEMYKGTVYAVAYSRLKSRSDADDVFQETFLLYYQKTLSFENEQARKAWLIRTALNLCKKHNLSSWATKVDRLPENDEELPAQQMMSDEENDVLQAVLSLKNGLREAVYLYYVTGLPIAEIAECMGISKGAVQVRLVRARKHLKNKLKGEYFYE